MEFETGNQFSYNQTNYWLLTMIIEKITGETFEDYILNNQFSNSKDKILFSSNSSENIPNRIVKNFYNTKTKRYEKHLKTMDLEHIPEMASTLHYRLSLIGVSILITMFLIWKLKINVETV